MTPVFGHGRLRLYLLKLLDENPRHGYEIIRLLQDRFFGLYAPSAGTVYPRLAKLEQEGLVTHSVEGGRKVYRITDAGRAELADRRAELDALEAEIRASVYERAREIRDEVRTSARNLRDELRQAARDVQDDARRTDSSAHRPWQRSGRHDPVSAWAQNLGPALSQKMVDLAEGLAQGLAGITEHHTRHLEDELRKRFGPDPAAGKRAGGPAPAADPWGEEADGVGGTGEPGDAGRGTPGREDTAQTPSEPASGAKSGSESGAAPGPKSASASDSGPGAGSRSRRSGTDRGDPTEFERLFDCFRSEIDTAAGHAGLTAQQVDRARDVLIRACTDLKDIFNDR
ncbi:helix-turn-helix transcriptional regulator [Yinghuangia sp. ASG 101]|uniref:helix-turn-helix transcriptional regulator n=1 Tax=Yinghuangia sp. ASG 101 TaxID=2896848 RepID=UPI001E2A123A|nr:helix-turn-helix transcriptional regulator [Yinghuangia sp. ASG 101]UGQ09620.1 helix-turn-helix transcriptional regulator [Yinghuangia sp. ASG 101]